MSAFANCGRAVAHVRGSYVPNSDTRAGVRLGDVPTLVVRMQLPQQLSQLVASMRTLASALLYLTRTRCGGTLMGRTTKAEAIRRAASESRRSPGRRQRSIQTKGPGERPGPRNKGGPVDLRRRRAWSSSTRWS